MKVITFAFIVPMLIFCLSSITSFAQKDSGTPGQAKEAVGTSDEREIRQLADMWKTHYNAGNSDKVAELYAEDAYYLSAHVLAQGRKEIRAYWERGIKAGGHIDYIRPIAVYYSGSLGYSVGTYQATNADGTVDGRILIVVKKVNHKWLMAAHETVVRDQP